MKNLILIVLLLPLIVGYSKLTEFQIPYTTTVVVPSQTLLNIPLSLSSPEVTTSSEQKFAIEDTRNDLIETIFLNSLDLTVEQP